MNLSKFLCWSNKMMYGNVLKTVNHNEGVFQVVLFDSIMQQIVLIPVLKEQRCTKRVINTSSNTANHISTYEAI